MTDHPRPDGKELEMEKALTQAAREIRSLEKRIVARDSHVGAIRARLAALLTDHGFAFDATDFGDDYLLACAVAELRWCLRVLDERG